MENKLLTLEALESRLSAVSTEFDTTERHHESEVSPDERIAGVDTAGREPLSG